MKLQKTFVWSSVTAIHFVLEQSKTFIMSEWVSEDKNGLKLLFHQPSTVSAGTRNINSLRWQLSSRLKVCGIVSVLQITNAESAILPYIDVWPSKVKTEACTLYTRFVEIDGVLFREGTVRKCCLVLRRYKAAQHIYFARCKWRCTALTPFNPHTACVLLIGWCSACCDSSLSQRTSGKINLFQKASVHD